VENLAPAGEHNEYDLNVLTGKTGPSRTLDRRDT
jgi:hypothetical protein